MALGFGMVIVIISRYVYWKNVNDSDINIFCGFKKVGIFVRLNEAGIKTRRRFLSLFVGGMWWRAVIHSSW